MQKGICTFSLIPVRSGPSHTTEMVTQLLFGEQFSIIEKHKGWINIRNKYDDYEGWIPESQFIASDKAYEEALHCFCTELTAPTPIQGSPFSIHIPAASILPLNKNSQYELGGHILDYNSGVFNPEKDKHDRQQIVFNATQFLFSPYLWGGKTFMGIDCSGLVQNAFRMSGIFLPRDSTQQAEMGETVNFIQESLPGDIAFFDNDEGIITHTGIILEDQKIIHASGYVKIDMLDQQGIFSKQEQKYTHKLRTIKKIL